MMEGYKKTDIGYIPTEWEYGRIDDYFDIQQGKSVSKANRIGNNQKPFLRTSNLLWGKVTLDELDYLHFTTEEEKRFKLEYNDLLVCEGGDIGRTGIWRDELQGCYYQNHLHRLRRRVENIDPVFVLYWMQYAFLYGKVYFGRANITTIPNLSKSRLSEFTIPNPPLQEQQRISSILGKIQSAIEQLDKLIQTTTELKKALMQKLFTEGTKGEKQKQTEIGLVPESWEVVRLGDYLEKTKIEDPSKKPNSEFIYVDVSSVDNELFKITNSTKLLGKDAPSRARKLIQNDDVIFATVRPTLKRIAKITAEFNNEICSTGYCVLKPTKTKLDTEFLYQYLQLDDFISRIEKLQRGASYPAVRDSDVKGMKFPLPKYEEQVIIGNCLKTLDLRKINITIKRKNLTDLFKTLLHELMTGQRRVNEIDFHKQAEEFKTPKLTLNIAAEP